MEIKKSKKADLERKRLLFFQLGLIVTLGLVFVAFEWTSMNKRADMLAMVGEEFVDEEVPPITRHEEITPPPPPPPKASDIITIVDNDVELDDELQIEDTEIDEDFGIDFSNFELPDEDDSEQVFIIVEDMPEFPGGTGALLRFISQNVRYPVICQENGIQGTVHVTFVINESGEVTNVKSVRGPDANLEREAVRVIGSLPKWKPGRQRGKTVKVSYNVPVRFILQ